MQKETDEPEMLCVDCGNPITIVKRHNGMYCNEYCCTCCPDAKKGRCQREAKEGNMFEELKNY